MKNLDLIINETDSQITIRFNRPQAGNLITPSMIDELLAVLENPKQKLLVVTGENNTFSKGRDPNPKPTSVEQAQQGLNKIGRVNQAIKAWPLPTIAVIEGEALGMALGLALHCDYAISSDEAVFAFPEIHHGIAPAIVASYLPEVLGYRVATDLLLTGKRINSQEALRLGIISCSVPNEQLQTEVGSLIETINNLDKKALAYTKRALLELRNVPAESRMQEGINRVVTWLVER